MHTTGLQHLDLVPCGCWDKDRMVDIPLGHIHAAPGTKTRWWPLPLVDSPCLWAQDNGKQWWTNSWKPDCLCHGMLPVQKVDLVPHGCFWDWHCTGSAEVLTPQHGSPAFVSTMSWRHGGFTTSPSHVPEKQDGVEQKQQRTIPTELIPTTSPKERQNEVFLGVQSDALWCTLGLFWSPKSALHQWYGWCRKGTWPCPQSCRACPLCSQWVRQSKSHPCTHRGAQGHGSGWVGQMSPHPGLCTTTLHPYLNTFSLDQERHIWNNDLSRYFPGVLATWYLSRDKIYWRRTKAIFQCTLHHTKLPPCYSTDS